MASNKKPFNVIVVGESNVGKTSLVHRYIQGTSLKYATTTLNILYSVKEFRHDSRINEIRFMDSAGQERFRSLTRSYYRRADAVIIMYDVTDRKSFNELNYWLQECHQNCPDIPKVIIGNKIDVGSQQVSTIEGQEFAKKNDIELYEMSANHDIEGLMTNIINQLIEKANIPVSDNNTLNLHDNRENQKPETMTCCNVQNNIFKFYW